MIALVFPFQRELEAFLSALEPARPESADPDPGPPSRSLLKRFALRYEKLGGFRSWTLESRPGWRLLVSGQGKVEAALACQAAAQALAPSAYVLLGSACGIDPALKGCDLVLSDPCIEYDFQHGPPPPGSKVRPGQNHHPIFRPKHAFPALDRPGMPAVKVGPMLSADRNVFDPEEKKQLFESHRALAAAWEGAGFHRFLRRNDAKGWELRLITEEACEGRPTLHSLDTRMTQGFAAVLPLLDTLEKSLTTTP